MIIPRNRCCLIKSTSVGGISCQSWLIDHLSAMRARSLAGPSIKACSSSVSAGLPACRSVDQFGLPLKSSPSHQTVPASMASFSVCDNAGNAFLNQLNMGLLNRLVRSTGVAIKAPIQAAISSGTATAALENSQQTMAPMASAAVANLAASLWYQQ